MKLRPDVAKAVQAIKACERRIAKASQDRIIATRMLEALQDACDHAWSKATYDKGLDKVTKSCTHCGKVAIAKVKF